MKKFLTMCLMLAACAAAPITNPEPPGPPPYEGPATMGVACNDLVGDFCDFARRCGFGDMSCDEELVSQCCSGIDCNAAWNQPKSRAADWQKCVESVRHMDCSTPASEGFPDCEGFTF